jgi:hypothetical protein
MEEYVMISVCFSLVPLMVLADRIGKPEVRP